MARNFLRMMKFGFESFGREEIGMERFLIYIVIPPYYLIREKLKS